MNWQTRNLGELVDFRNGVNFSREQEGVGIPILKVKDFGALHHVPLGELDELDPSRIKVSAQQFLKPKDIVIIRSNGNRELVGRSMIYNGEPEKITFSGFCIRARALDDEAVPEFIHYWLRSPLTRATFAREGNGTGINNLSQGFLSSQRIQLPDPDEQSRIVRVLGALDDKIELNRRINETLEEMARALFRDWFVDFGPTRRQMEGETSPAAIMGRALPSEAATTLAPLFPAKLGDDGLPEGWSYSDVGAEFDVEMGQSPPGDTYNETGDGLPFFQGRRDFGFRFPSRRVYCTAPKRISGRDWTLLSVRAPVGDINRAAEKCAIGRGVGAFLHKAGLHSFTYYTGLALRAELQSYDKDGTVFGSINQKQFKGLQVVVPDHGLSSLFDEIAAPLDDKIRLNTEENQTLAALRDLLLPKLMSGDIRLKDVEAAL